MNIPENLKYTKDHEWIKINGDIATIGITSFAQGELGDIVFVDIDTEGEELENEEVFGTIEAVKTVADIYSPIDGEISKVNTGLEDKPELINQDPYEEGWIIKLCASSKNISNLLTPSDYRNFIK